MAGRLRRAGECAEPDSEGASGRLAIDHGDALERRDPGVSPLETLRRLAHRLVAEDKPYVSFSAGSRRYVETVENSEALKARARGIRDELAGEVAAGLAASVGRAADDPDARLAAALLLAAWTVGFIQAHAVYRRGRDAGSAKAALLAVIDRAARGLEAAMAGTPYARRRFDGESVPGFFRPGMQRASRGRDGPVTPALQLRSKLALH